MRTTGARPAAPSRLRPEPEDTCRAAAWKHYPYVPDWGDPHWFTFPDVDGYHPDLGMATYFVDGFLRGRATGTQYAFMVIFTDMRVLRRLVRASFYTFALYDCDRRRYGTYTDYDFPRLLWPLVAASSRRRGATSVCAMRLRPGSRGGKTGGMAMQRCARSRGRWRCVASITTAHAWRSIWRSTPCVRPDRLAAASWVAR